MSDHSTSTKIVHNVYFTLKEDSPANRQRLVDSCGRWLSRIPGITFFAAGTLVPDLTRPVNDLAFHVGLHVVFANREAHDTYQVDERHQSFISENKESWEKVRVFDSEAIA